MHHTYTNIVGKDRDIGYGILRMSEDQPWRPYYLGNPLYAVAAGDLLPVGRRDARPRDRAHRRRRDDARATSATCSQAIWRKVRRQTLKDYVLFPALTGPAASRSRWPATRPPTWSATCGRSRSSSAATSRTARRSSPRRRREDETRGQWYYRQLLGSANLTGGKLFHILSGNLSHQIEHHLFPDLPAHRYAEIAVEVREICERYGLPYNAGPLHKQFGSVVQKICRLALPDRSERSAEERAAGARGAGR